MAAFYARAISPTLVIRKTFVYGVTVALLLFAYATMEAFVGEPSRGQNRREQRFRQRDARYGLGLSISADEESNGACVETCWHNG